MIARIEHERTERESLEQRRMELLKRKQKLIADNKKRKDDLANLDKDLEKFIEFRRDTASLRTAFVMGEFANDIKLSDEILSKKVLVSLNDKANDVVGLSNVSETTVLSSFVVR